MTSRFDLETELLAFAFMLGRGFLPHKREVAEVLRALAKYSEKPTPIYAGLLDYLADELVPRSGPGPRGRRLSSKKFDDLDRACERIEASRARRKADETVNELTAQLGVSRSTLLRFYDLWAKKRGKGKYRRVPTKMSGL
jgi:hypothetical protein